MHMCACLGVVVKITANQPLIFEPLTTMVAGLDSMEWCPRTFVGPLILVVTGLVSTLFADAIATLINLVGSLFCMNIAFVFPAACYWKLFHVRSLAVQTVFVFIIFVGLLFAILGALSTFGVITTPQ